MNREQNDSDPLSQAFFRDRNVADEARGAGDPQSLILKRLALYLVPIFLILAAADVVLRKSLPPERILHHMQNQVAFYTQKVGLYSRQPSPDVLFLGSSRVREGVNTKVFADALSTYWGRPARAFNLGLNQALAAEYQAVASSHIQDPPPPYVVIGLSGTEVIRVHEFNYASRFLWTLPDLFAYISRTSFEHFDIQHVEYFIESLICKGWYLFAQRDAFQNMMKERIRRQIGNPEFAVRRDRQQRKFRARVLAEDGYEPFNPNAKRLDEILGSQQKPARLPYRDRIDDPGVFDEKGAELLGLIVKTLRSKGCRVAFVETPPSPYLQNRSPVVHGRPFFDWIAHTARGLDVLFIPVPTKENGLTNAMYMDYGHLSAEGAKHYTRLIFEKLKQAGFFDA